MLTTPIHAHCNPSRLTRRCGRPPVLLAAVMVAIGLVAASLGATALASDRPAAQPPSVSALERRATEQGFTAIQLLGNDAIGVPGSRVVVQRVARAWEASKQMYLGQPQDPAKAAALRDVLERWQRRDDQLHGDGNRDDWRVASARLRLMAPAVSWPGESSRQHRTRVAAVLVADRASSADFWKQVRQAKDAEPSESVKVACGVIELGPSVIGAIGAALRLGSGEDRKRQIREACEKTGKRVQDTTGAVANGVKDVVTDPLGTLAKGVFGPLIKEVQKATSYASKQVGAAIDKVATPDLSARWVREMLKRAATIAVLIAFVAGILGVIHAAVTANLGALMGVVTRALLSGVVGSAILTVLNVAVVFVDLLTSVAIGAEPGQSGKRFATFADTATAAMARADVPSLVALLLLLVLLLGLVVVWWEMWLRAPFLYACAFFYGPAFSASLFPPARQVLSQLNALLAAIVLMPFVVLSLLEMAVASLDGGETVTAVLQASGLVLLAAASPAILVALLSPSVALSAAAGMAGALGTGRAVGRGGRRAAGGAASATLGAAGFARDRLNDARRPKGGSDRPDPGLPGTGGFGGGGRGGGGPDGGRSGAPSTRPGDAPGPSAPSAPRGTTPLSATPSGTAGLAFRDAADGRSRTRGRTAGGPAARPTRATRGGADTAGGSVPGTPNQPPGQDAQRSDAPGTDYPPPPPNSRSARGDGANQPRGGVPISDGVAPGSETPRGPVRPPKRPPAHTDAERRNQRPRNERPPRGGGLTPPDPTDGDSDA